MTVFVRRTHAAHPDFVSLIGKLDNEFYLQYGDVYLDYQPYNSTADLLITVVAYADHKPVACGALRRINDQTAELKRIFVLPDFRRQGFAQRIIDELENASRELGFIRLVLETGADMDAALALYKKLGYDSIPGYGPYANDDACVCMAKEMIPVKGDNK